MTRTIIAAILLLVSSNSLPGQWYRSQYGVNSIDSLGKDQLYESLDNSRSSFYLSLGITGFGGVCMAIFKYLKPGMSEDPGFFEQLLGDSGVNKVGFWISAGITGAGAIASIVFAGRLGSIRSAIDRNYPGPRALSIRPQPVIYGPNHEIAPGLALTYRF